MASMVRAMAGGNRELGVSSGCPTWMRRSKYLGHALLLSSCISKQLDWKRSNWDLTSALWGAYFVGSLTCCATLPAPSGINSSSEHWWFLLLANKVVHECTSSSPRASFLLSSFRSGHSWLSRQIHKREKREVLLDTEFQLL